MQTDFQPKENVMEYEGPVSAAIARPPEQRPTDLLSLRSHMEKQVERAREIAYRVDELGDDIFGPRPVSISGETESGPEAPPALALIVSELDRTLARIEAGLNRL